MTERALRPARAAVVLAVALLLPGTAIAHRDGCHRWHSCPSDTRSYVCGDLGYCSQCPDNRYCLDGRPREAALPVPSPAARPAPPVVPPSPQLPARVPSPGTALRREPAKVVRVIDGDTVDVEVAGRRERIRLIGLNTPESVDPRRPVQCFGREASAKAKALLPRGSPVQLEADPSQGERDRYRRLLRYVFLPDGRNFAQVMIEEGYGHEYTYRLPYTHMDAFKAAERAAREGERGLWAPNACPEAPAPPRAPPAERPPTPRPAGGGTSAAVESAGAYPCQSGQIKGNRNSGIYRAPGQQHYSRMYANVQCFVSEDDAVAAGFRRARR